MRWTILLLLFTCMELSTQQDSLPLLRSEEACIANTLYDEARGEGKKGMRAVLDTIYVRMKKRNKTACEVVSERGQFSAWKDYKSFYVSEKILTDYSRVATIPSIHTSCDYYHANYVQPQWASKMQECKVVGKHKFYRSKGK